jgi:hypothetical protein
MADYIPDNLNFWEEVDRMLRAENFERVVFRLINGDRYLVTNLRLLAFYRTFVAIFEDDGNTVMFPIDTICTVQVLLNE